MGNAIFQTKDAELAKKIAIMIAKHEKAKVTAKAAGGTPTNTGG